MDGKKFDPPRIARNGRPLQKSSLSQLWIPSTPQSQKAYAPRLKVTTPLLMPESEAVAMGLYCGCAVLLALVTKYAVSGLYWNLNFFLLFVQSSLAIVVMGGLRYLGIIEIGVLFDRRKALAWAPLALVLVLQSYVLLKALQCLSLPTYTILSNLETIALATFFGNGSSGYITTSFAVMIVAAAGAVWSDYDLAKASQGDRRLIQTLEPSDPVLNLVIGCTLTVASIWLATIHYMLMRRINKKTNFKDWDVIWYNNLLILPISGALFHLIEDFSAENLYDNFRPPILLSTILSILALSLLAPLLHFTSFHSIRTCGEKKTAFMKEGINKFAIAACGVVLFGGKQEVDSDGVVAVIVGGVGGWLFIWAGEKWRKDGGGKESLLPSSIVRDGEGFSKDYL